MQPGLLEQRYWLRNLYCLHVYYRPCLNILPWKAGTIVSNLRQFMGRNEQQGLLQKMWCLNTLKYTTIENDFTRRLVMKAQRRLKLEWSLSKVSVFSGQDHIKSSIFNRSLRKNTRINTIKSFTQRTIYSSRIESTITHREKQSKCKKPKVNIMNHEKTYFTNKDN